MYKNVQQKKMEKETAILCELQSLPLSTLIALKKTLILLKQYKKIRIKQTSGPKSFLK